MKKSKHYLHGGDLDRIEKVYGIPRSEIVDFSGNINPIGISPLAKQELAKHLDLISTYPDRNYFKLREAISEYTGAPVDCILVGNGSTELISLMIQLVKPKKGLILGPTYSEYEREIFLCGGATHYYPLKETSDFEVNVDDLLSHLNEQVDLLVICNPNNPTSSAIRIPELRIILDHCKENNIFVMIDETYIEFADNPEGISAASLCTSYTNMLILRGISKFFAAPGLRLGYGICSNQDLIRRMNELKNPWTINILASFATQIMLKDMEYIEKTKALMQTERNRIYEELCKMKHIKVYKPTANFILFKILREDLNAEDLFVKMIQEKMLIRDASSFPFLDDRFVRFCILNPEENTKLLTYLKKCIEE